MQLKIFHYNQRCQKIQNRPLNRLQKQAKQFIKALFQCIFRQIGNTFKSFETCKKIYVFLNLKKSQNLKNLSKKNPKFFPTKLQILLKNLKKWQKWHNNRIKRICRICSTQISPKQSNDVEIMRFDYNVLMFFRHF